MMTSFAVGAPEDPVDPAIPADSQPSSAQVSSLLMQDTVCADGLSIDDGPRSVALFANPFNSGREEFLAVSAGRHLTHVRRNENSPTGWQQVPVMAVEGDVAEVVAAVHPDGGVWAAVASPAGELTLLVLRPQPAQIAGYTWAREPQQAVPDGGWTNLHVAYVQGTPLIPVIYAADPGGTLLRVLYPEVGVPDSIAWQGLVSAKLGAGLDSFSVLRTPGLPYSPWDVNVRSDADTSWYLRNVNQAGLDYYTLAPGSPVNSLAVADSSINNKTTVQTDLGGFLHPNGIGWIGLQADGSVVFAWPTTSSQEVGSVTLPLGFSTASAWTDGEGMTHVYGIDESGTLTVLHQTGWNASTTSVGTFPVWTQAAPPGAPARPIAVPMVSDVVSSTVDPYPDLVPNLLVKRSGVEPKDAYVLYSQDVTSDGWSVEPVCVPPAANPVVALVTRYVSEVSVLDRSGRPIGGQPVRISADTLTQVYTAGTSHLVGPRNTVELVTDRLGKLTLSVPGRGLTCPGLTVSAPGLDGGAAVRPATGVQAYLAGTGTLPGRPGTLTGDVLEAAAVDGQPLVPVWHETPDPGQPAPPDPGQVVSYLADVFSTAAGQAPPARPVAGYRGHRDIIGFAVQTWDPARPAYRAFVRPAELEEHRAALAAHPRYGGVWEDVAKWFSDLWESIKDVATTVWDIVVNIAEGVAEIVLEIGGALIRFLVNIVTGDFDGAAHVAEALFQQIQARVERVVDWLKALFDLSDIWDTKKALQTGFSTIIDYGVATFDHMGHLADDWFEQKEAETTALFDGLKAQYAGQRVGDFRNQAPRLADASGAGLDQAVLQSNPQANWMLNQLHIQAAAEPGSLHAALPEDSPLGPIADAFNALVAKLQDSGIGDDLTQAAGDLATLVSNLLDPANPNAAEGSSMVAFLDLLERLALIVLKGLDAVVQAVFAFITTLTENLAEVFNLPLELGIINTIYDWVRSAGESPHPAPEPDQMTVGDLFFLIAAFFVTVIYKLINGVDSAPFPGGTLPSIPAPPWHPSYDPAAQATGDPAANSRFMVQLQLVSNICGVLSGLVEFAGDILPVYGLDQPSPMEQATGCLSLFFSSLMFGVLPSIPPVTGGNWANDDGTPTLETGVFAWSVLWAALSGGAVATSFVGQSRAVLKNVHETLAGPVIATLLGGVMIGLEAASCAASQASSYVTAASVLAYVPAAVQFVRMDIKQPHIKATFPVRAFAVAGIDLLGNEISAFMSLVAAADSPPGIIAQSLPSGQVGMAYDQAIRAKGGDQPYNAPLRNWTVRSGALPAGLTLDAGSGHIQGAPEQAGTSNFRAGCTDSYGPPKYSADSSPLTMTITSTPVGQLAVAGPTEYSMEISTMGPAQMLTVKVTDQKGQPLAGAVVRFTLPVTGPSATFQPAVRSAATAPTLADVVTGADGTATAPTLAANSLTGTYTLTAAVPGVPAATITYTITNTPSTVTSLTPVPGSTPQSAKGVTTGWLSSTSPGEDFPYQISVTATGADGSAKPGTLVAYTAPPPMQNGWSVGCFAANGSQSITTATGREGVSTAGTFTAKNAQLFGPFKITATVPGTSLTATFDLTVTTDAFTEPR